MLLIVVEAINYGSVEVNDIFVSGIYLLVLMIVLVKFRRGGVCGNSSGECRWCGCSGICGVGEADAGGIGDVCVVVEQHVMVENVVEAIFNWQIRGVNTAGETRRRDKVVVVAVGGASDPTLTISWVFTTVEEAAVWAVAAGGGGTGSAGRLYNLARLVCLPLPPLQSPLSTDI